MRLTPWRPDQGDLHNEHTYENPVAKAIWATQINLHCCCQGNWAENLDTYCTVDTLRETGCSPGYADTSFRFRQRSLRSISTTRKTVSVYLEKYHRRRWWWRTGVLLVKIGFTSSKNGRVDYSQVRTLLSNWPTVKGMGRNMGELHLLSNGHK